MTADIESDSMMDPIDVFSQMSIFEELFSALFAPKHFIMSSSMSDQLVFQTESLFAEFAFPWFLGIMHSLNVSG